MDCRESTYKATCHKALSDYKILSSVNASIAQHYCQCEVVQMNLDGLNQCMIHRGSGMWAKALGSGVG